jgi:glycosyltransferase involved in cell wall biosynthesis
MKIYINGRFLSQKLTGVQRYAEELLKALNVLLQKNKAGSLAFEILAPRNITRGLDLSAMPLRLVGRLKGHLWEELELPFYARGSLLFNPCGVMPYFHGNQVTTLHDAVVFAFPSHFPFAFRNARRINQKFAAKFSRRIITDSFFSKQELIRLCGAKDEKVSVVYLGSEHILAEPADPSILEARGLLGRPFVLSVSTLNRYKNFPAVSRAAYLLKKSGQSAEVVAVGGVNPRVFGKSDWGDLSSVRHIGSPSTPQLRALYESAACFVFPSFYEGFGLPPLEAMVCGCPVVASNAAAIPEILGDAALYFDPKNPAEIVSQVSRVLSDLSLRSILIDKGRRRAAEFNWARCADQTLEVMRQVVG